MSSTKFSESSAVACEIGGASTLQSVAHVARGCVIDRYGSPYRTCSGTKQINLELKRSKPNPKTTRLGAVWTVLPRGVRVGINQLPFTNAKGGRGRFSVLLEETPPRSR